MNKGFLSIFLGLSLCLSAGAQSLYFPVSILEGGSIKESDPIQSFSYEFENISGKPLRISSLRTNCSCSSATCSSDLIQPGEKASIILKYSPKGRSGSFDSKVYVYTDQSEEVESILSLRIRVVDDSPYPYRMGPYALQTKEIVFQKGKRAKARIGYRKVSDQASELKLRQDFLPPFLKAKLGKESILVEYKPDKAHSSGEYPLYLECKEKQTKVIIKVK